MWWNPSGLPVCRSGLRLQVVNHSNLSNFHFCPHFSLSLFTFHFLLLQFTFIFCLSLFFITFTFPLSLSNLTSHLHFSLLIFHFHFSHPLFTFTFGFHFLTLFFQPSPTFTQQLLSLRSHKKWHSPLCHPFPANPITISIKYQLRGPVKKMKDHQGECSFKKEGRRMFF